MHRPRTFIACVAVLADTSGLEREIDEQVYALYQPSPRLTLAGGLTPTEIKLVEESQK